MDLGMKNAPVGSSIAPTWGVLDELSKSIHELSKDYL